MAADPAGPDHSRSTAVVIGVSGYQDPAYQDPELGRLASAANSLALMRGLLADPALCGWPPDRIEPIPDPSSPGDLAVQLREIARRTKGTLLLYYVGHGELTATGELMLTVTTTVADAPKETGLRFDLVRDAFNASPARVKVAILDCCGSGSILPTVLGPATLANRARVKGTHILTAATGNSDAHRPPADANPDAPTSFTAVLADVLRRGLPGKPDWLTLADLFPELADRLREQGLPEPGQAISDTAIQAPFTRNTATGSPAFPTEPVAPAGLQHRDHRETDGHTRPLDKDPATSGPTSGHPEINRDRPIGQAPVDAPHQGGLAKAGRDSGAHPGGTTKPLASHLPPVASGQRTATSRGKRLIVLAGAAAVTAALLSFLHFSPTQPPANTDTNTVTTISVGSTPGAVAVDSATHAAYVTDSRGDYVSVIDTATNAVTGYISVGSMPEAVAVDSATHTAYVTNSDSNVSSVSVINTATNAVTSTISFGKLGPSHVAVDPASHTAYITNFLGESVSVIDTATNTVTGTITFGNKVPAGVAVDSANHTAYITTNDDPVLVVDTATNTVTGTINTGTAPHHVAVDTTTHTAYIANYYGNSVSVINTATNTVTGTINVGKWPDAAAVDPANHTAYVINYGDNTVSVIKAN